MQFFHHLIGPESREILWWQMCVRTVIIFFYGVALIRLAGRRAFGRQSALDIMLTVLVGSSLARALTGGAPFLPTMAAMFLLMVIFQIAIHVAQRSDLAGWIMKGEATTLLRDGRPDQRAMRASGISHLDLDEAARAEKVLDISELELATLERSGRISVIPRKK